MAIPQNGQRYNYGFLRKSELKIVELGKLDQIGEEQYCGLQIVFEISLFQT